MDQTWVPWKKSLSWDWDAGFLRVLCGESVLERRGIREAGYGGQEVVGV